VASDDWCTRNVGKKIAEFCLLQARTVLMEKLLVTVCDIMLLDILKLHIAILSCECSFPSNWYLYVFDLIVFIRIDMY
jgi:hypothetical protein